MKHPWYCLLLLLGSTSLSLADTVCVLSRNGVPLTETQWTTELSLTNMIGGPLEDSRPAGQTVIEFDAANIDGLDFNDEIVYLQPVLSPDKSKFTIAVGKDFPDYELNKKDEINIGKKQLVAAYPFMCSGGSSALLNIIIDLKDTNNHAPNFVNGGEDLTLPMPFPSGVVISRLLDKPITIEDIDFSTKQMDLTLDSTSQTYFSVQSNYVNDVTWTAEIVTIQELQFEQPFTITLTATDVSDETPSQSSPQTFAINIDTENSAKNPPAFTKPLYQQVIKDESQPLDLQVKLTEPDSNVSIDQVCVVDPDNGGDQACELLTIGSQASDGSIPITWNNPSHDDISNFKYILATISATSDIGVAYTVIHIALPVLTEPPATTATPCPPCTTTQYTTEACEPCTTTVMECPTTITETTTPCEPCTTTAFECPTTIEPTTTECPVCTTTPIDCPTYTTTACEPCTTTVMECTTPPVEPCECTTNSPDPGTTSQCEPCEPCECGSTTTSKPGTGPDIHFDQDNYVTTIGPNEVPELFNPTVVGGDGYEINYSLMIDGDYLALRIAIDENTGRVWLKANLLPGSYEFHLKAEAMGTTSIATAPALIGVTSTCNCDGGRNVFYYALFIPPPVLEHGEQSVIIPGNITDETCTVSTICFPESGNDYVNISTTGDLSFKNLDREVLASFFIDLQINCADSEGAKYLASKLGYDSNIEWDVNTMRVVVTVGDINDNPPNFALTQFSFGYPKRNLLPRTMPSAVGVVVATDADEGDNAKIEYNTNSRQFNIHPDTGVIYVRHDALDYDEETFPVTAHDLPTNGNRQTATATVTVKILDESHIFVITVEDATNEDIDEVLNYLSTDYSVHALSITAAFDGAENATVNSKRLDGAAISMIVYALNKDGNPVTMNEFQSSLPEAPTDWRVSGINALPVEYGETTGPIDNTGFIAAVSVLGALLGLILLGFACIYIFVIRPKLQSNSSAYRNQNGNPYDQPKSVTNEGTEEDAPRNTGGYNAWTTYNTSNQPKKNGKAEEDRKPSVTIWKQEFDEKTGKVRKPESSDNIEEDEENDYDRRKSLVTFNENVECIEVDRL